MKEQNQSENGIFNYVYRAIGINLMARTFHDASHEGHGERLIQCWKPFTRVRVRVRVSEDFSVVIDEGV